MNAPPKPIRPARTTEHYAITCPCSAEFEAPAAPVDQSGVVTCGACGRISAVNWRAAAA